MPTREIQRSQIYLTTAATVYITSLLAWEQFHGGVVSHHILHRDDLPAISNWWGLLLLPALTWFLAGRINKRGDDICTKPVIIRLLGSMLYGALLSVAFLNGLERVTSLMGPGLLVLALFLPIFKAEYVLGFILTMTFTFGALLPTGFAVIVAPLAFVIFRYIRPAPLSLLGIVSRKTNGGKSNSG